MKHAYWYIFKFTFYFNSVLLNNLCYSIFVVPGVYTPWGDWEECSVTCGLGSQSRSRSCTNPSPEHGGPTCLEQGLGEATEDQACDAGPCPGNGFTLKLS